MPVGVMPVGGMAVGGMPMSGMAMAGPMPIMAAYPSPMVGEFGICLLYIVDVALDVALGFLPFCKWP